MRWLKLTLCVCIGYIFTLIIIVSICMGDINIMINPEVYQLVILSIYNTNGITTHLFNFMLFVLMCLMIYDLTKLNTLGGLNLIATIANYWGNRNNDDLIMRHLLQRGNFIDIILPNGNEIHENFINVNDVLNGNHVQRTQIQNKLKSIAYKNTRNTDCVICFERIKNKQLCVKLHNDDYHKKCLIKWFKQSNKCPTCNTNFLNH